MAHGSEFDLVKVHFPYLFDEYGFSVIDIRYFDSFTNWVAVVVSKRCRIRFFEDRGGVELAIGPLWDPPGWQAGPWFDLPAVLAYLNHGVFTWDYGPTGRTGPQLERLSAALHPQMGLICAIFSPENYPKHEAALRRLWDERYAI